MAFQDKFYEAVAEWLREEGYICDRVYLVEQDTEQFGYCDTCWYEEIVVLVHFQFTDEDGINSSTVTWRGDMSEFIGMLG